MDRFIRKLPLPTKLMLIAAIPVLYIAFLTARLYQEKEKNVDFINRYLQRIDQSSAITLLIDEMQKERLYSFEYVLNRSSHSSMMAQRQRTDSAFKRLLQYEDHTINDFPAYTFLTRLDSTRLAIDSLKTSTMAVIHFYSSSIFRLNTLNRPPTITYLPLEEVYREMHFQRLLSEIITYQGIIAANVYTVLYTKQYPLETLIGTLGTYEVYKSYESELAIKASSSTMPYLKREQESESLRKVDAYLHKLFTTYRFDSTYTYAQWRELSLRSQNELRAIQGSLLKSVWEKIRNYYQQEKASKTRTLIYLIVMAAVLAFLITYVVAIINQSLKQLKSAALRMAEGETDIPLKVESNDAIGSLAGSIRKVDEKNRELAMAAESIGKGDFQTTVKPRSIQDKLGNALVHMRDNLRISTENLERSREEFKLLADFVPLIVWTATEEGTVDYYNKRWYEVTGSKMHSRDQSWITVLHPEDVGNCLTTWYRSVESGDPYEIEYRILDVGTKSYRWFLGRAVPLRNEEGKVIKWFGTATDIHDQKVQKEKLEELVTQRTIELKRSNEDLQQFAHVASHDLKEPVRKIRTFSQRLADEFGSHIPEKGRTYVDKIQASSERMSNMIDSILSYSVVNATEFHPETIDLNLIMEGINHDLELLILQKEAKVEYHNLPRIKGIPTLIYQLFYNLVTNSLKFTDDEVPARITIQSAAVDEEARKTFSLSKGKQFVELIVRDNGIGFSQEFADKIFNVFTRLNGRNKYEGTGLGLALCRKIVHRHDGIIYAKSEEGKGAEFHVILPTT